MTSDSPFFLTRVECPLCRTINEFETVRVGAYVEEGRDTDFCPSAITWRYPRYQAVNPLTYFIAVCNNCYYARELNASFKDWKNDNNYRTYRLRSIKEKHLDQLSVADSFVKEIGDNIDIARYPNESAILKLQLAVFDEQLSDHYSRLDIGRFYLRIAWIFRSMEREGNPHYSFMQGLIFDLETKYRLVKDNWQELENQVADFAGHLTAHFDTDNVTVELKSHMYPYRDRFKDSITSLQDVLVQNRARQEEIELILNEYKSTILGSDGSNAGRLFGSSPSFGDFLLQLKSKWNGMVVNEQQALRKAIQYYKEAFSEGKEIAPGNQQIQATYLIAELSRRVGDFDEARRYFNSTIRYGQEFVHKNRNDQTQTALARKILELAVEQGRASNKTTMVSGA